MLLGVSGMGRVKVLQLVTRLRDGQGLLGPVDGGVCGVEPGESEDDIFLTTAHDIEEMLLNDPLNVCIKGASVVDCTSLVCGLVHIADHNRRGKFLHREAMFSDKLSVNTGDVSTRVYQYGGVNDFESV